MRGVVALVLVGPGGGLAEANMLLVLVEGTILLLAVCWHRYALCDAHLCWIEDGSGW